MFLAITRTDVEMVQCVRKILQNQLVEKTQEQGGGRPIQPGQYSLASGYFGNIFTISTSGNILPHFQLTSALVLLPPPISLPTCYCAIMSVQENGLAC